MIEQQTIGGRAATVMYLTADLKPCSKLLAEVAKVDFADGETLWLTQQKPSMRKRFCDDPLTKSSMWLEDADPRIQALVKIIQRALNNCRDYVVREVGTQMRKATPSPREEAEAIVTKLKIQDELYAIVEIERILEQLGGDAGKEAVHEALDQAGITPPNGADSDIWNKIDENMADYAKKRSAELIGMRYDDNGNLVPAKRAEYRIDDTTRNMLNGSLSSAIQAGMTANEIQRGLMNDYAFSPARALNIARTEAAFAHSRGAMTGYRATRDRYGFTMRKRWTTGADPCDICVDNEAQGFIPLDDSFDSGDDAPPAHPSCRCDIVTEVADEPNK